jgi:hypothetical protein
MDAQKLQSGDIAKIAKGLNCHRKSVEFVLSGARGARETDLQKKVKAAAEFIENQNKAFKEFCTQISIESITPQKA